MKVYGSHRYEAIRCPYGCCSTKWSKERNARKIMDRCRRKTGRQLAKKEIMAYDSSGKED